jgi:hypothetical protein
MVMTKEMSINRKQITLIINLTAMSCRCCKLALQNKILFVSPILLDSSFTFLMQIAFKNINAISLPTRKEL